jgi:hypothetical protein
MQLGWDGEKQNWSQPCSTLLRRVVCAGMLTGFELCARAERGEAEERLHAQRNGRPRSTLTGARNGMSVHRGRWRRREWDAWAGTRVKLCSRLTIIDSEMRSIYDRPGPMNKIKSVETRAISHCLQVSPSECALDRSTQCRWRAGGGRPR